jgi:hypothetical protein
LLLRPRIEIQKLAVADEAVYQHLREPVGRRSRHQHVLVVLQDADRDLSPVVGVGRIKIGLARRIDDSQHVASRGSSSPAYCRYRLPS